MPRSKKIKVAHDNDAEDEETRVTRHTSRRWKGFLEELPSLPIDLLHEVFQHLSPLDLVHLARTSKDFRKFILHKSASGIWKAARSNIEGLPECPPYMSEPAYANLMFSPHCHYCLSGNIQNIITPFSVRYCNSCKKMQCVESYMLGGRGGFDGGLTDDMFCTVPGERRKIYYHKPDVERTWEKWLALPDDDAAREKFKQTRRQHVQQVLEHSSRCDVFVATKKASRSEELKAEKKRKVDQVVERLTALGWGKELDTMKTSDYYELREHIAVRQLKKVTDKTWAEVEKPIVVLMKSCRKNRLILERRRQIKERLNLFAQVLKEHWPALRTTESDCGPEFVDYALMPAIREIVAAPANKTITRNDFSAVKHQLSNLEQSWRLQMKVQLCHVTSPPSYFDNGAGIFLATAFYDCTHCGRRALQYPAVCAHECLRSRYYRGLDTNDSAYLYLDTAFGMGSVRPWSCQALVLSPTSERAKKIIEACGEDPETVHQSEMNTASHRLCCTVCSRAGVKLIMDWRSAVEHCRIAHSAIDEEEPEWEKVSDAEAAKVKEIEEEHIESNLDEYLNKLKWSCARCNVSRSNSNLPHSMITDHVRLTHQVVTPTAAAGDIYVSGDSPQYISQPVVLASIKFKKGGMTSTEKKYWLDGGGCFWDFERGEAVQD
ncbi:hypothetical protein BXZ70DRAFT_916735 [Cristinia sonorae]|uniref:F-box domain-containing protein n=1 Tax=Cristinia sonorae TaxID=1940300 RepID=A0A8K0UZ16_9AGAR|nr:hypothetical protein BXZ70DRAFT_916735 [Cristinia sonorae]